MKDDEGQFVLIPAQMAYADVDMELEITRAGDVIKICPARGGVKETIETLPNMPKLAHDPIPRTLPRETRWG